MTEQEKKLNLLLFLNAINKRVLNSLQGTFFKTAKYKYSKIVNAADSFEKEVLRGCPESALEAFKFYSPKMTEIMNISIDHYNNEELDEFIEYCKKF